MNANQRLTRLFRCFLRNSRGASTLEFAFVMPIMILLSLGTVDFGRAMWTSITLKQVASEAGRFASIRGAEKEFPATEADIVSYAKNQTAGLNTDDLIVNVSWAPNNTSGSRVTVTIGYDFNFVTIGFLPLDTIRLEHSSVLTIG